MIDNIILTTDESVFFIANSLRALLTFNPCTQARECQATFWRADEIGGSNQCKQTTAAHLIRSRLDN